MSLEGNSGGFGVTLGTIRRQKNRGGSYIEIMSRAKLSSKRGSVECPSSERITIFLRIARWLQGGSWT